MDVKATHLTNICLSSSAQQRADAHLRCTSQNLKGLRIMGTRPPSRGMGYAGPDSWLPFASLLQASRELVLARAGVLSASATGSH